MARESSAAQLFDRLDQLVDATRIRVTEREVTLTLTRAAAAKLAAQLEQGASDAAA